MKSEKLAILNLKSLLIDMQCLLRDQEDLMETQRGLFLGAVLAAFFGGLAIGALLF